MSQKSPEWSRSAFIYSFGCQLMRLFSRWDYTVTAVLEVEIQRSRSVCAWASFGMRGCNLSEYCNNIIFCIPAHLFGAFCSSIILSCPLAFLSTGGLTVVSLLICRAAMQPTNTMCDKGSCFPVSSAFELSSFFFPVSFALHVPLFFFF